MTKARGNPQGKRRGNGDDGEVGPSANETVRGELERVRAHYGLDPATGSPRYLAGAWTSPTGETEENEAEFVDAMADCVSAGVPLAAAVASWSSGALARVDDEIDDAGEPGRAG